MQEEKIIMFRNRLGKVFKHLQKQAKRLATSCYRVYDHDLPEFPFCIEFYGDKLYIAEYKRRHGMTEEEHDEWMEKSLEIIREILGVLPENIFLKLRQRKPGRLGQYQKLEEQLHEFRVEENKLKFIVNLSDYLDTGLFLDHRLTREMVGRQSEGKKILNLFAYTGSFSVYAAAGGATEVVSVDLSNTYLKWAGNNFAANELKNEKFQFIQADVLQYLPSVQPGYFDIIVLDPPTFSNSKRMVDFLDIQRDHPTLIRQCLEALQAEGELYFSTNFKRFLMDEGIKTTFHVKDITRSTTAFDFEGRNSRFCFLIKKSVALNREKTKAAG